MRLINANRVISRVDEIPSLADKNQAFYEGCRYMKKRVLKIIRTSKTIDAVPVVRCKDCKYYTTEDFDGNICCGCKLYCAMLDITPDGFCSYGERKEAEHDAD